MHRIDLDARTHDDPTPTTGSARKRRPPISEDTLMEHLDWLGQLGSNTLPGELDHLLKVAELAVRVQGNRAQGKATQHTLVEQGVIDPPPTAS